MPEGTGSFCGSSANMLTYTGKLLDNVRELVVGILEGTRLFCNSFEKLKLADNQSILLRGRAGTATQERRKH